MTLSYNNYNLRAHHLVSLIKGYINNFTSLEDGLKKIRIKSGNDLMRVYTDEDAVKGPRFYRDIISDPENRITLVEGIDDRCKICSNCDGRCCTHFNEKDLLYEDKRSLIQFPDLYPGITIKVSDLIPSLKRDR